MKRFPLDRLGILYKRRKGVCAYCSLWFERRFMTIDHIIPKRDGGTNALKNLTLACWLCNQLREGDRPPAVLTRIFTEWLIHGDEYPHGLKTRLEDANDATTSH